MIDRHCQLCPKCNGCGRVADTESQEPWSVWEDLPLKSSHAVIAGVVNPITCSRCGGTGFVDAMTEQPMPKPGRAGVTDAVIEDLRRREQKGIETYGTTLQTHNGRNALQDAYEEVLDLAQYLKQHLMEQDTAS